MNLYKDIRTVIYGTNQLLLKDSHDIVFIINENNGLISIRLGERGGMRDVQSLITAERSKDNHNSYFYKLKYENLNANKVLNHIHKIDSLDLFYRYCQERLLNFRGRNISSLASTLHELAYRYNHRDQDLFEIIINKLK